ncbi:MAG: glycosyltransferase, partial [Bacteroidota bacterium]
IEVVNLSSWHYRMSSTSNILGRFHHQIIPNGINLGIFKKIDKLAARRIFNLPPNKQIILFVADNIENKKKGFDYLLQALERFDPERYLLVVVGSGKPVSASLPTRCLNFIGDDRLLAAAYSAADVYVIPTLEDNLPNTVLEAMGCETPVVGFNVGGLPDMIKPNKTGLLARMGDAQDLSLKIQCLLEDEEFRLLLGKNARSVAEKEYNIQIQTRKYIQLYEEVLKHTDQIARDAKLDPSNGKLVRTIQ